MANFISPSQIARVFECPGSVREQSKVEVQEPPSPYALEGTAIHELASRCLKNDIDPKTCVGQSIEVEHDFGTHKETFSFVVNDDFIYTVELYMRVIYEVLVANGLSPSALQVESYDACPEIPLPGGKYYGGTVDCKLLAGSTLHIFDLKGGRGVIVDVEENKQCMSYAVRSVLDLHMLIDKVVLWIVQPRAKEGDYVKKWETTPEHILSFIPELKDAIEQTKHPQAPLNPGKHCQFCKAAATCPGMHQGIIESTKSVIPKIHTLFPDVRSLTPQQIGTALPALEALKVYLESLQGYALTMLHRGQDIPNYTLTKSNKHRKWKDERAVMDLLSQHLQEDDYLTSPKLRTPAQIEKLVGKELVEDYIFKPEGDLKLVMEKDAKEYIKRNVEDVFKDVTFDN